MNLRRKYFFCSASTLLALVPASALGAPNSSKDNSPDVADALASEAEAQQAASGDEAALTRLQLAYDASGRAVHGLAWARKLLASKKLAEAFSAYRRVASQAPSSRDDSLAIQTAATEVEQVTRQLSRVRLQPPAEVLDAELTLDGRRVTPNAWLWLEPGHHELRAARPGAAVVTLAVDLATAERRVVQVPLQADKPAAPIAAAPAPTPPREARAPAKDETAPAYRVVQTPSRPARDETRAADSEPEHSVIGSSQRLFGYMLIGWGVAGLAAGTVTYVMKNGADDADKQRTFKTISTIAFATGGGLTAIGVAVVLTAPSGSRQRSAAREPFMGRGIDATPVMDTGLLLRASF